MLYLWHWLNPYIKENPEMYPPSGSGRFSAPLFGFGLSIIGLPIAGLVFLIVWIAEIFGWHRNLPVQHVSAPLP